RALGHDTTLETIFVMGERAGSVEVGKYQIFNMYGSSEAIISMLPLASVEDAPIGEAFAGQLDIIDNEGNLSDEGELVYRGRGIMLGYLHQVAGNVPSEPLKEYYTGDLARRDETGLHIIGRKGDMIKINGQRVEPAEVEYAIAQIPGIDASIVKAFFDNGTYMCAYYTSAAGVDEETVRQELVKKVNPYMVPSFIKRLDAFPLNPNGKADRAKLETLRPKPGKGEAPTNEVEYIICSVFAKVLNEEAVTLDDVFMKVGGDSIKAIRAQSELADMGVVVTIDDILDNGTPRIIAEKVMANSDDHKIEGTPVTPMQALMTSGMSRHGDSVKIILKAVAPVNPQILQKAINIITDRHTALRSSFAMKDGKMVRTVREKGTPVCTLGASNKATIENPLAIYPTDAEHLVIEFHRAIIDVRSIKLIMEEVAKVYMAEKLEKPLPVSFGSDFDYWWAKAVNYKSYAQDGEAEHWKNVVSKMEPCRAFGKLHRFEYGFMQPKIGSNVFAAGSEEITLAAILRAYSKVYGRNHISTDITATARNLAIGRSNDIIGNLDACYPAVFDVAADGSVEADMYSVMKALRQVPRAGLGFGINAAGAPMAFPELSLEFIDMALPESPLLKFEGLDVTTSSDKAVGISMSVAFMGGAVRVLGAYADIPEIAGKFEQFLNEIKTQIAEITARAEDNLKNGRVEVPLTTLQLLRKEVIVGSKKMPIDHTISVCDLDIPAKDAVEVIEKYITFHPSFNTRLVQRESGEFWLEYAGKPEVIVIPDQPLSANLLQNFEISKALCRFIVMDKGDKVTVLADLHHQISDITTLAVVAEELKDAAKGKFPKAIDLGIVYAYWYQVQQQHLTSHEAIADFYDKDLGGLAPISPLTDPENSDGKSGYVNAKLTVTREELAKFAAETGISVGAALTAAFGYVHALFVDRQKTSFFFLEHGRHMPGSERTLGMYFRVLPMAVDCQDVPAVDYVRGSMKNMLKAMAIRYSSPEDYQHWMQGDYVQFKYQSDMNERSGVDRLLDFMPPASYLSFMVGDLGKNFEVQLKYPPTASHVRAEKLVKAYDIALSGFLLNHKLSDISSFIKNAVKL
ncbi:MAG: condensation domain-containing protein, partial [archaeon]|nr:condensation domain-containing protein [archaeon]